MTQQGEVTMARRFIKDSARRLPSAFPHISLLSPFKKTNRFITEIQVIFFNYYYVNLIINSKYST